MVLDLGHAADNTSAAPYLLVGFICWWGSSVGGVHLLVGFRDAQVVGFRDAQAFAAVVENRRIGGKLAFL